MRKNRLPCLCQKNNVTMMSLQRITVSSMFLTSVVFCKECSTQACLTNLYNSNVIYAEYYTRPLASSGSLSSSSSSSSSSGRRFITDFFEDKRPVHAGVVVTVTNGDRWLIHKGSDYGDTPDSPDTVIVDASLMSDKWTKEKESVVYPLNFVHFNVNDFLKMGAIDQTYSLLGPNCQTAANKIWKLVDRLRNHHLQTLNTP